MECVSKWITFQLSLSFPPSLFFFPLFLAILSSFLLSFSFFLQVSFSLSNGLHVSAKWPWHCDDKVKCPRAQGHAVSPRVRSQCSAYSTQSQLSANPPVQTTLSGSPFISRSAGPVVIEKKLWVSDAHFSSLGGQISFICLCP